MQDPESEIIKRHLEGDEKAFEELVSLNLRKIYNFIYRMTGRKEESNDIVQEVFFRIWKNLYKFKLGANFKTWMFSIARNAAIDWQRKKKTYSFSELDNFLENGEEVESFESKLEDTEMLPDEIFEQKEIKEKLEKILGIISPSEREIILLRHLNEFTFDEIAEVLKKPMNTVKSQYRRSMQSLRKKLSAGAPNQDNNTYKKL